MKYRVTTDKLADYARGDIVSDISDDEIGLAGENINRSIVERNPYWFEQVQEFKEGKYVEEEEG